MSITLSKALGAMHLHSSSTPNRAPNTLLHRHRSHRRRYDMQHYDHLETPHQHHAPPPPSTKSRMPRQVDAEVIVISDDDDVENKPPHIQGRRSRPLSTDSSDSEAFKSPRCGSNRHRSRQHHASKRRKAKDGDSTILEGSGRVPLMGVENGYTKASLDVRDNGLPADPRFHNDLASERSSPPNSNLNKGASVQTPARDLFESGPPKANMSDNVSPASTTEPCPFYYDPKLEVKMYRGPGYERFPVVLGTVKGHKAICENWEAERKVQHQEDQLYIASLTGGVDPRATEQHKPSARLEERCLRKVRAIFPGIETNFVLNKFRARYASYPDLDSDTGPSATEIISEIAELDAYPFEAVSEVPDEVSLPEDGTGVTIVYKKDTSNDDTYRKEALRLLAAEFTHIPTISISRVLQEKHSLFDTFIYLHECEATYFDLPRDQKPYSRSKQPRLILEKKYQQGLFQPRDVEFYANLVNELQAARQKVARELHRLKMDKAKEEAEAANLAEHKHAGSLVECQTCFDNEIPINRAITCDGEVGHFFCFSCVAMLAESQIGAMKHQMLCMDGSGCQAVLSVEGVGRAVPTKVVDKLAFYEQQAEISAAGIEGLEQCPHCEYKAICDPIEEDCVFLCQNPDCGKNSCRKCHEIAHVPKSCEEAKKDRGLSARHVIEEARSEAMIRKCPKCRAKIIKELGCNKMICSCGGMMCYVCQQDISGSSKDAGYQHFHKAGSKCPLYDAQGTERHDQDANDAEKEAIKRVKAQQGNEDLDDKSLQIETGKPTKDKQKNQVRNPPGAFLFDNVLGLMPDGIPLPPNFGAGNWDHFPAPFPPPGGMAPGGQREAGPPLFFQDHFMGAHAAIQEMHNVIAGRQFDGMQQQAARVARMARFVDRVMDMAYPVPMPPDPIDNPGFRIPRPIQPRNLPQHRDPHNFVMNGLPPDLPQANFNRNNPPIIERPPAIPPLFDDVPHQAVPPAREGPKHLGELLFERPRRDAANIAVGARADPDNQPYPLRAEPLAPAMNLRRNTYPEPVRHAAEPLQRRRHRPEPIVERVRGGSRREDRAIRPRPSDMHYRR